MDSDAIFKTENGEQKMARWQDIVDFYEFDVGAEDYTRMCYKLSNQHVYPESIKKMKVKMAAQVFSHRVSSTMRVLAREGT